MSEQQPGEGLPFEVITHPHCPPGMAYLVPVGLPELIDTYYLEGPLVAGECVVTVTGL